MLHSPTGFFTVFHRNLPTMELLVSGKCEDRTQMFVEFQCLGDFFTFNQPITQTETIAETIRSIILVAHQVAFTHAQMQLQGMKEEGFHVS